MRQGRLGRGLIRRVETLRLLFGAVWAIDAYLKWQPSFIHGYAADVASAAHGQPDWLRPWFRFWRQLVSHDPRLLAGGALLSLGVWIIPEGFGGSFLAGATAIGTAVMYALIFAALYGLETLPAATGAWTVDRLIERKIRWWHTIAEPDGLRRSQQ
jgi:thiosulfate dehydrogenase (quinone) large subunit